MSEKDNNTDIVKKVINISWPCDHQLISIHVIASREDRRLECPYCLLKNIRALYEDDKDKLGDDWKDLIELVERIID